MILKRTRSSFIAAHNSLASSPGQFLFLPFTPFKKIWPIYRNEANNSSTKKSGFSGHMAFGLW